MDRALLLILRSLRLQAGVRPVIDREEIKEDGYCDDDSDEFLEDLEEMETEIGSLDGTWWKPPFKTMLEAAEEDARLPHLTYDAGNGAYGNPHRYCISGLSFQERLEKTLPTRRIRGLKQWQPPRRAKADYMGSSFEVDIQGLADPEDGRNDKWAKVYEIHWSNEPKVKDLAMAYIAYGNEAEMAHYYASAAILARIPPANTP